MRNNRKLKYYRSFKPIIKQKLQKKLIAKYKKVRIYKMKQHLPQFFQILSKKDPVRLVDSKLPTFRMPSTVKVIIQKDEDKRIPYEQDEQGVVLSQIPVSQFLQYTGQLSLSIAQMKLQQQYVDIPQFVKEYFTRSKGGISRDEIESINLWYYKGKRISTWHYDGYDNFLFVLKGKKIVFLQPPTITSKHPKLFRSKSIFNVNYNHIAEGYSNKMSLKQAYKCIINKGECLFIPRGWWHYVFSYGEPNIAINIWGNSYLKQINKNEYEPILKFIIHELSQNFCLPQQQQIRESNKQILRKHYFVDYLKNIW